jgi:magnesium transporter
MKHSPMKARAKRAASWALRRRASAKTPGATLEQDAEPQARGAKTQAVRSGDSALPPRTVIRGWCYDRHQLDALTSEQVHEIADWRDPARGTWLHVTGLEEPGLIGELASAFGLHPLTIEDVLNTNGRAKVDDLAEGLFITLKLLSLVEPEDAAHGSGVESIHFALYAAPGLVLTFAEKESPVMRPIMMRLLDEGCRLRALGADYLVWAILDAVIDHAFVVIDALDEHLQRIDVELQDGVNDLEIAHLFNTRHEVVGLHRLVRPLREIAGAMTRSENAVFTEATTPYFQDLYDHAVHALDHSDDLRDYANSLRDFALACVNQRMNEIMKVLACVSAIFLPLTFLAGVYGMNFDHMPELRWPWGYGAAWGMFLVIAVGLGLVFRRRRWL